MDSSTKSDCQDTRKADDIMGMAFPPLRFGEIDGVGIYPKQPEVKDQSNRGDLSGQRVETVVYVFEREGSVTIPGHIIPWFDLKTEQMNFIKFPSRSLEVSANSALAGRHEQIAEKVESPPFPWRVLGWIVGLSAIIGFLVHRYGLAFVDVWPRRAARIEASEAFAFKRLCQACRNQESQTTANLLGKWLMRLYGQSFPVPVDRFLSDAGDSVLTEQIVRMNEGLYANDRNHHKAENRWNWLRMLKRLIFARRKIRNGHRNDELFVARLSSLNPAK